MNTYIEIPISSGEPKIELIVKLPTSSDLFKKHFSNVYGGAGVGIFHPNMESFFEDLNNVCKIEDSLKIINNGTNAATLQQP